MERVCRCLSPRSAESADWRIGESADISGNITVAHALGRGYIGIADSKELKNIVENQLDMTPIIKEINL